MVTIVPSDVTLRTRWSVGVGHVDGVVRSYGDILLIIEPGGRLSMPVGFVTASTC